MTFSIVSTSSKTTSDVGFSVAKFLEGQSTEWPVAGSTIISLIGDLGSGKTQLVRGLAVGLGADDNVQSPSFTISRIYEGGKFTIYHYDFYRLGADPGVVRGELEDHINDPEAVVVTEWSDTAKLDLAADLTIKFSLISESERKLELKINGSKFRNLKKELAL